MSTDYKNWVPKGMVWSFGAGTGLLAAGSVLAAAGLTPGSKKVKQATAAALGAGAIGCAAVTGWCIYARSQFSYEGVRKLSKSIVEGTAGFITSPEGGKILDVGCGSGALSIACARRNPNAEVLGIDYWGPEYHSFSQKLCERNAASEGVGNVTFQKGDANHLEFADETFDAVTSNYVYHNIAGANKQALLKETLRVLKKGGTFAIHDLMGKARYGDMEAFVQSLKDEGYEDVKLIPTADGLFMDQLEAKLLFLSDSALLAGRK